MKMNIAKTKLAAVLALGAISVPQAAFAQVTHTWDVYNTFNSSASNAPTMAKPWIYGQRASAGCGGATSPLAYSYSGPSGSGFTGWQGVNTPTIVPLIGRNPNATTTVYSTAQVPANSVWLHPGETGVNPVCATVRFKAPMTGRFRVKGFFRSIDTGANKVNAYIIPSSGPVIGPIAISGPMGTQVNFDHVFTLMGNPRYIDFAIDDGGSYYNDSTQLSLTVVRCPPKGKDGKDGKGGEAGMGDAAGPGRIPINGNGPVKDGCMIGDGPR